MQFCASASKITVAFVIILSPFVVSFSIRLFKASNNLKADKLWDIHICRVCILHSRMCLITLHNRNTHTAVTLSTISFQNSQRIPLDQMGLHELKMGLKHMAQLKVPSGSVSPTDIANFLLKGPVRPFLDLK